MVGKTPQVREIVYNVLDDSGERTVIAKGATTVDVGDTRELFTRTSNLEAFTTNNFSNISVAQSNILQLENFLGGVIVGGGIQNIYSPLLLTLQSDHADNVDRIEVLEEVHLSNSLIVSNNFSNITVLQEIVDSNIGRIDGVVADQLSNTTILDGTFSNVSILQGNDANNFSNISELQTTIQPALTALQEGQALQDDVSDLKNRITTTSNIVLGSGSGEDRVGVQSTILGITSGRNIGDYSIGIGFNTQNYSTEELGDNTDRSMVINATGNQLNAIRRDTLVIAPIQTDDSNTINIMGYNDLTKEVVQSTLLRGIDGNVHATTNISVNNDTILFETNGNGSFGGDIEIAGNLEVGGTSSFTGAMQVDDTLEIADTSSFGGDMTIDANAFVYGQSFAIWNDSAVKIKLHNNGTGSFLSDVDIGGDLEVGGTSSFTGAMQVDNTLEIADTSSFGGDMTIDANAFVYGQSFAMYDGTTENIYIRNDGNASFAEAVTANNINCNETLDVFNSFRMVDVSTAKATINKLGQSSFAGKMQIDDALVVDGHSSFIGGIKVLSPSTSSFGGPVIVNNTSSFTGVARFEQNISVTGQEIEMFDATLAKKISISNAGNASFAEAITVNNINCNQTLDVFNSFRMVDDSTAKATINKDGTSSFAGEMQISNTLVVDDILTIKNGGATDGKVTINPGDLLETITVQGAIYIRNGGDLNASITRGGVAYFKSSVSSGGDVTTSQTGSFGTLKCDGTATLDAVTTSGTGSFGTLNCDGTATLDAVTTSGTGSFGTLDCNGTATLDAVTTSGTGSFGTLDCNGTATLDDVTTSGTGSFGTLKCDGTATLDDVTTSGTGSFGTLDCNGTATSGTGSFGTLNCGGTATLNGLSLSGDSYMRLEAGTSQTDYCDIKQVGTNNNYKLVFDFYDDSNDLDFGLRSNGTEKHTWSEGDYTAAGTISAGTDVRVTSDERLKSGITQIPGAIEKVKQIRGCTYTIDDKPSAGVIAQELIKVLPESVHTKEDGYYGVSYHGVIALLIEAVKELSEKVK